jgi:hypothetical protein
MRSIGWFARVATTAAIAALAGSALSGQRAGEASRTQDGQPDLQGGVAILNHHSTRPPFFPSADKGLIQIRRISRIWAIGLTRTFT